MQKKNLKFSDITNRYSPILIGFVAQLYVLISVSLYYLLEYEFNLHLGITRQQLITYYSLFSIIILICLRQQTITAPIAIADGLIVIFFWLLLGNLLVIDCQCCVSGDPNSLSCFWQNNQLLYSLLCVALMFISFLFNSSNYYLSIVIKTFGIGLIIFVPVVPITCNQFLLQTADINIIKLSLFITMWLVYRRLRLTEIVISNEYMKSIAILKSYSEYKNIFENSSSSTKSTKKPKKAAKIMKNDDDDDNNDSEMEDSVKIDYTIPSNLFSEIERHHRSLTIGRVNNKKRSNDSAMTMMMTTPTPKDTTFEVQLKKFLEIHDIHRLHYDNKYFSWKNRYYDTQLLFILDLASTIWILTVCPLYLFFIAIQFVVLLYNITETNTELQTLEMKISFMDYIWDIKNRKKS